MIAVLHSLLLTLRTLTRSPPRSNSKSWPCGTSWRCCSVAALAGCVKGAEIRAGSCCTLILVHKATQTVAPFHSHWLGVQPTIDGRRTIWRRKLEAPMRSVDIVQVDDATPIVLSFDNFVIRGIHGSVGPSRCTRH
jgi:hypothetical protein